MMPFLARRAMARAAPSMTRSFSVSSPRPVAKITIVGNLAATPEVKITAGGRSLVKYSLASQYGRKDDRKTSWFRVSGFMEPGPRRDYLTSLGKGSLLYIEGEATLWRKEGSKTDNLDIRQTSFEVLRRGSADGSNEEHSEGSEGSEGSGQSE